MFHTPVLLKESLEFLNIEKGEKYIDATVGGGGHAVAILERGGSILGLDMDPEAVEYARETLTAESPETESQVLLVKGNFRNIDQIAKEHGFEKVAGILFDLGMSSWQLEGSERGFSFMQDGKLDMRMDPSLAVEAKDLLGGLTVNELEKLFSKYAEEKHAIEFAKAISEAREIRKIKTTQEFSGLLAWVEQGQPSDFWNWYETKFKNKPSEFGSYDRRARFFQALRIAVNDEINNFRESLPRALRILKTSGRLVIITFHSLERGVVKRFYEKYQTSLVNLTPRGQEPGREEVEANPKARSAKLFAYEKK
ncbi:MAG: 16S rRNA (cytosine(1402)-N(4))-methyltransferase RsmH [Patescibacteria group bacterium]|nr:16S rRNA (cytosine(1402)-N(4))-methyltransferase RsmH [Patescibacteria group bacterium]